MQKIFRHVMIMIVSLSMVWVFCSCGMLESYKEFHIKNITDHLNEDYFTSETFDFARFQDVVVIPEVKEVNHGEYVVYVSVYSKDGKENIRIKNIIFREKETVLFNNELGEEIKFEENAESIYEGWITGGTFTEETLKIADGEKYDLVVEVEMDENDETISKNITFQIDVKRYQSFVWPT